MTNVLAFPVWVLTVCKGCQQMTKKSPQARKDLWQLINIDINWHQVLVPITGKVACLMFMYLGLKCLAQGHKLHNAVTPVRLEPAALPSRVKHYTTEPLRSNMIWLACFKVGLRSVFWAVCLAYQVTRETMSDRINKFIILFNNKNERF